MQVIVDRIISDLTLTVLVAICKVALTNVHEHMQEL